MSKTVVVKVAGWGHNENQSYFLTYDEFGLKISKLGLPSSISFGNDATIPRPYYHDNKCPRDELCLPNFTFVCLAQYSTAFNQCCSCGLWTYLMLTTIWPGGNHNLSCCADGMYHSFIVLLSFAQKKKLIILVMLKEKQLFDFYDLFLRLSTFMFIWQGGTERIFSQLPLPRMVDHTMSR